MDLQKKRHFHLRFCHTRKKIRSSSDRWISLEAGLMTQRNKGQQERKWARHAYLSLFRKYHVTKGQFMRNLDYYQKDPKTFCRIYDTVINNINKQKGKSRE